MSGIKQRSSEPQPMSFKVELMSYDGREDETTQEEEEVEQEDIDPREELEQQDPGDSRKLF